MSLDLLKWRYSEVSISNFPPEEDDSARGWPGSCRVLRSWDVWTCLCGRVNDLSTGSVMMRKEDNNNNVAFGIVSHQMLQAVSRPSF